MNQDTFQQMNDDLNHYQVTHRKDDGNIKVITCECERCGDELPYHEINDGSGMCQDCEEVTYEEMGF